MDNSLTEAFASTPGSAGMLQSLLGLALGLLALGYGRRFYWVFVGLAGFALGIYLGPSLVDILPPEVRIISLLALAGVFAILALAVNRLMIGVAGLLAAGYIAYSFTGSLGMEIRWLAAAIGAALGGLFAVKVYDWGLVALSAVFGAQVALAALVALLPFLAPFETGLLLALATTGLVIQGNHLAKGG
jgi:hypothetical protein